MSLCEFVLKNLNINSEFTDFYHFKAYGLFHSVWVNDRCYVQWQKKHAVCRCPVGPHIHYRLRAWMSHLSILEIKEWMTFGPSHLWSWLPHPELPTDVYGLNKSRNAFIRKAHFAKYQWRTLLTKQNRTDTKKDSSPLFPQTSCLTLILSIRNWMFLSCSLKTNTSG